MKRIHEIDMMKGLCIVFIALRHLCELTGVNVCRADIWSVFNDTESVMILFVLLSGYVFRSKGSIRRDIQNKAKQLMIPYLLFGVFFTVTYFIRYVVIGDMSLGLFAAASFSNLLAAPGLGTYFCVDYVNNMVYAFVPYWYIAQIFPAFLLFIPLNHWLKDKKDSWRALTAAALLALSFVLFYLDRNNTVNEKFTAGVSYFIMLPNIVAFAGLLLIGSLMRRYNVLDLDAHSPRVNGITAAVCIAFTAAQIALRPTHQYVMQFAKWGPDGIWSVCSVILTGFTLTCSLNAVCCVLKRVHPVEAVFSFIGKNSLTVLLAHFGLGELIIMILGIWVPVYAVTYPQELYSSWHLPVTFLLTAVCIGAYLFIRDRRARP